MIEVLARGEHSAAPSTLGYFFQVRYSIPCLRCRLRLITQGGG